MSLAIPLPVLHASDSAFSYTCNACSRCCYDKRIIVNPYELARLARNRGISTTEVIAQFTEDGGTALTVKPNGACIFLGRNGCTVHADRPLVCRLYPLGRVVQPDGSETYVEFEPHPDTAGVYGQESTIGAYVESQGAGPYITAADRYYALLVKLMQAFGTLTGKSSIDASTDHTALEVESARFVDADLAVRAECERTGESFPHDVEALVERHLLLLERWLDTVQFANTAIPNLAP